MNEAKDYVIHILDPYKNNVVIINEECDNIDDHIDTYIAEVKFYDQYGDPTIIKYDVEYYIYSGVINISISLENDNMNLSSSSNSSYHIDKVLDSLHESLYDVE